MTLANVRLGFAFSAVALGVLHGGCAHPEVETECQAAGECGEDIGSCISAREAYLGEIGGRCGDASDEAIAVFVCQGTLGCDERDANAYEAACASELEAFRSVRDAGGGGCEGAPDPIAP